MATISIANFTLSGIGSESSGDNLKYKTFVIETENPLDVVNKVVITYTCKGNRATNAIYAAATAYTGYLDSSNAIQWGSGHTVGGTDDSTTTYTDTITPVKTPSYGYVIAIGAVNNINRATIDVSFTNISAEVDYTPHKHSYSSTVTKAATCTSAGSTKFTCACGDEYTDNTKPAALGHSPGPAATCTTSQTCTVCGTTLVAATGHSADAEATCTTPQTCTKCGKILAPAKGHTFTATTIKADYLKSAATCTAEAVYYRSCLRCGLSSKGQTGESTFPNGSALGHDYATTFTVDKKATCTADGSKSKHCSRCSSKTDVTVIPKRAHTIVDTTVKTEATCTTDGVMNQKCSNTATNEYEACAYTTTRAIPAKGHSWNDPTYTWSADGKSCTAQRVCKTDANHKETATATITSAVKTAATCTAKGTTTYTAKFNVSWASTQTKDVQDIAQLSHSYTGAIKSNGNGKDATHSFKCVNGCNQYGGAVKHTWNSGSVTKQPTCTESGVRTYTCTASGCGATYTETISAKGHTEVTIPAVEPTCTATGLTAGKKCSVCGAIITAQQTVPAKGHSYTDVVTQPTETANGYTTHTCKNDSSHSYVDTYTCLATFKNYDGSVLKTEKVNQGGKPTAPTNPTRTGYKFIGWSPAVGAINNSTVFTAVYEKLPPQITTVTITRSSDLANVSISAPVDAGAKFIISVEVT